MVPVGNRLTIEPGVVLDFKGHYSMVIDGHLTAIGTADKRIVFTSSAHQNWPSTSGTNRGWNGLRFWPYKTADRAGGEDWVEYCEFSYSNKTGNMEDNTHGSYIEATGGAVYVAGRPSSMTASIANAPITFHFNNNYLHHNVAARSGGAFFNISAEMINPVAGAGTPGVFKGYYVGNVFEDNICNTLNDGYGGGAWSMFHGPVANVSFTFKGGALRRNTCMYKNTGHQIGPAEGYVTLDAVIVTPTVPEWKWTEYSGFFTLLNGTPLMDR